MKSVLLKSESVGVLNKETQPSIKINWKKKSVFASFKIEFIREDEDEDSEKLKLK